MVTGDFIASSSICFFTAQLNVVPICNAAATRPLISIAPYSRSLASFLCFRIAMHGYEERTLRLSQQSMALCGWTDLLAY